MLTLYLSDYFIGSLVNKKIINFKGFNFIQCGRSVAREYFNKLNINFFDSYREVNLSAYHYPGLTWSPGYPKNNFDNVIFLTRKDSDDFTETIMENGFKVVLLPTQIIKPPKNIHELNNYSDIIKNLITTYTRNKNY